MMFGIGLGTVAGVLRGDLLRRPPHHHPDRAVPRPGARRTSRREHQPAPARRAGARSHPLLGVLFFVPGDEPRRHPPDVGLPRQGRAHRRRPPGRHAPGLRRGRRRHGHQPADPVRRREGLEPRVLAHPGAGARDGPGPVRSGRRPRSRRLGWSGTGTTSTSAPARSAASDLDEARSIVDEDDGTDQDLHQLLEDGALPSRLPRTMVGATGEPGRVQPRPHRGGRPAVRLHRARGAATCSTATPTSPRCCPEESR